jgi:hypothetical protein
MNLQTTAATLNSLSLDACRECVPPLSHQAAYNKLTRIGWYFATDLSRQTKRENMASLVLIDLAQQIIRLESKMAGKEVR